MDEGCLEAVDADRRMIAIRYRDGGYCVARLLGRHTPKVGQCVRGRLRREGGSSIADDDIGESAAIFVSKARCSRSEALGLLERGK